MTNRQIVRFLVVNFLLAFAAQWFAIRAGVRGAGARPWLLLTMWMPAVAALASSRASRSMALASLRRTSWRSLGAALLVGWSCLTLMQLLLLLSGTGRWNETAFELAPGGGLQAVHGLAMALGVGPQGFPFFALNLVLSVTLGSVISGVIGGVGEELGWRAVLQPELERRFGPLRETLAVSAIWAAWHLPINLAGYNDPAHPVWTALLLFPLSILGLSFGLAWLIRRSGSVFPPALAHGANNALNAGLLVTAGGWASEQAAALASAALVAAVMAWWLVRHSKVPAATGLRPHDGRAGLAALLAATVGLSGCAVLRRDGKFELHPPLTQGCVGVCRADGRPTPPFRDGCPEAGPEASR